MTRVFQDYVAPFADFIASRQRASGAITAYPTTKIEPTFGYQACFGLVRFPEYHSMVRSWLQWCVDHQNMPDPDGKYATLWTHNVVGADEVKSTGADADDSALAHFITVSKELYLFGDDTSRSFVRGLRDRLEHSASSLETLIQADHLSIVKKSNTTEYAMDNAETWRGLTDMAWLCTNAFGSPSDAPYYEALASAVATAYEATLWDVTQGRYKVATSITRTRKGRVGGISGSNLQWYKGRIATISGAAKGRVASIAGSTATMLTPADAGNFVLNDRVYWDDNSDGLSPRSGILRVLSSNAGTGLVTFSANVAATISGAANNDYIFPNTLTMATVADGGNCLFGDALNLSTVPTGASLRTGSLTVAENGSASTGVVGFLQNVRTAVTGLAVNDYLIPGSQSDLSDTPFAVKAGDVLVLATDTAGATLRSGSLTVQTVDTATGLVTCTGAVTAGIAAAAVGDYVYRDTLMYPDCTAQIFAIAHGLLSPTGARAIAQYAAFNARLPNWHLLDQDGDSFIHGWLGYVAHLMGDRDRCATFVEKVYREMLLAADAQFFPAEAGWLLRTIAAHI
jgi:hypothetical protein